MQGATGATPARATQARLLERERELAALDDLIERTAAGGSGLAIVEGPAGIGKTRLLAEARTRASAAGLQVLWAQASELEREAPFGVVRQLFERAAKETEGVLSGAAEEARIALESAEAAVGSGDPSFASLHGLYWLTINLSERAPLFIAVDDLQWCDRPSLRFLAYLRRRVEGLPVLLVCAARTVQGDEDLSLTGEIAADPDTVPVRPGPLSSGAVAELGEAFLGEMDADFAAACHEATGGNPLLCSELMKALAAEEIRADAKNIEAIHSLGPRAVSRGVLVRLARLPGDAAKVARSIAVLGDARDLGAVAQLAEVEEQDAARAVTELVRAEILSDDEPIGFAHPMIEAVVHEDIPPGERGLLHARAAELLSAAGAPASRVAAHLLLAPPRGRTETVEALREAATAARAKGSPESAVAYLSRALAEPPPVERRTEVLLELGRAEESVRGPAAVEHLTEARRGLSDPEERALAAQVLGRVLLFTGHPGESAEVVREAAAELAPGSDDLRMRLEALELLSVLWGGGERESWRRLEAYRRTPGDGAGAKALTALAAQAWLYEGGPSDRCAELSVAALAGGELLEEEPVMVGVPLTTLALADREEAMEWWEVAKDRARRRGSLFAASLVSLWYGWTLLRRGELPDAAENLRASLDELELWGYGTQEGRIYSDAFLASALREQGDLVAARAALEQSTDVGRDDDGARFWLDSSIELLLAESRFDEGLAATDEYARRFGDAVRSPIDSPWRSHKAIALAGLDRNEEALAPAREELELAREGGAPGAIARAARVVGTLEGEAGLETLRTAAEVTEGTPAKLEYAKSLLALGSALRRARRPADAREPLRRGVERALACGAESLAEHGRSELYAAGGRPRTTALTGIESLTASERRVASKAADGLANREIAEALFVTPKTVEMHLSNAYRKLGISSRRELPAELREGEADQPRSAAAR